MIDYLKIVIIIIIIINFSKHCSINNSSYSAILYVTKIKQYNICCFTLDESNTTNNNYNKAGLVSVITMANKLWEILKDLLCSEPMYQ